MTLIADSGIPLLKEFFGPFGEVVTLPAGEITPENVREADALIVRSITKVDRSLLTGSAVRFVGSATIGTDHIDTAFLRDNGIHFSYAPGCNAESVVEYVIAALCAVSRDKEEGLAGKMVGIIGCGAIGSRLTGRLEGLGMQVLCCDPPREERGETGFVNFQDLLRESDIVTLHCPLSRTGDHSTRHLINAESLSHLKPGAWLINTARGGVVDGAALSNAIDAGQITAAVLDVWENEPHPDPVLISRCHIATPHIAGYSRQGKINGARMIATALADWLGAETPPPVVPENLPIKTLEVPDENLSTAESLDTLVSGIYNIRTDDRVLRSIAALPDEQQAAAFHHYRQTYPNRLSFSEIQLAGSIPEKYRKWVYEGLGIGC